MLQSSFPSASASVWTAASTRSHTPANRQRRKRVYTLSHGPYRSGKSRHGAPVRSFHKMPFTISRCDLFGRPVLGRSGGSSGASRSHSASVISCRRTVILNCTQPDQHLKTVPSITVSFRVSSGDDDDIPGRFSGGDGATVTTPGPRPALGSPPRRVGPGGGGFRGR